MPRPKCPTECLKGSIFQATGTNPKQSKRKRNNMKKHQNEYPYDLHVQDHVTIEVRGRH